MKSLQRLVAFVILMALLTNTVSAATLNVDRADNALVSDCVGITDNDCTLRGALTSAANGDSIVFNEGIGTVTIDANGLPDVKQDVNVNGTITGGFITIDGNSQGDGSTPLFRMNASGANLHDIIIYNWNGVAVEVSSSGIRVTNSKIGINSAEAVGATPLTYGIQVQGAASNTTIQNNTISGSTNQGVLILGAAATTVVANKIGTNSAGTAAIANGGGIGIAGNTSGANVINDNTISGNTGDGILFSNFGDGTLGGTYWIHSNEIGTNAAGTAAIANGGYGIQAQSNANSVLDIDIGSNGDEISQYAEANVISGNTSGGIKIISGSNVDMRGNLIGIEMALENAIPNGGNGVEIDATTINVGTDMDGTVDDSEGNYISGNTGHGLLISGTRPTTVNIKGNDIGVGEEDSEDGTTLAIANTLDGIRINTNSATLSTLNIGGVTADEANRVSANTQRGIYIEDAGSTPSSLTIGNNIIGFGYDGTDLGNGSVGIQIDDGNTVNIVDNIIGNSGGKAIYMIGGVIAVFTGNIIGVNFTDNSAAPNAGAGLEVRAPTLTSLTIGGALAALSNVIAASSGYGIAIFDLVTDDTPVTIQGNYIGVCADPSTGEIENDSLATCRNTDTGVEIEKGAVTIGGDNSLGDAGTGTIGKANVISNNYGAGIALSTDVVSAVIDSNIIGLIRNGAAGVFNVAAGNGLGEESTDGISVSTTSMTSLSIGGVGLTTASSKRIVVSSNEGAGISIAANEAYTGLTATIKNAFIGTDWLGAIDRGNGDTAGVAYTIGGTLNLGGTGDDEGNVISGNTGSGVLIWTLASEVLAVNILQNLIGLGYNGTTTLANDSDGINFNVESVNTTAVIGNGTVAGRNIIAGNGGYGLNVDAGDVTIKGNYLGVASDGTTSITNTTGEIYAEDTTGSISNLTVGGAVAGEENTISNTTAHVGFTTNIAASNEATLDGDNTWLETTIDDATTPTNRFWERVVNAIVLAWGPYQCNDGIDNDGDGNIDNGGDAGCSTIYDNTENSDVAEEEPASGGGYIFAGSRGNSSTETSGTSETSEASEAAETAETTSESTEVVVPVIQPEETVEVIEQPVVVEKPESTKIQKAIAKQLIAENINSTTDVVASRHGVSLNLLYTPLPNNGGEVVVKKKIKSVQSQKVETLLQKSSSDEGLNKAEVKEFEKSATDIVQAMVSSSFDGESDCSYDKKDVVDDEITVKSQNGAKKITKKTRFVVMTDTQKAKAAQIDADENGEDVLFVTTSTVLNDTGVSTILTAMYGGDPRDKDYAKKIFYGGNLEVSCENSLDQLKPSVPTITNLNDKEVGENAVFWIVGKPNEEVSIFAVSKPDMEDPDTWEIIEIGRVDVEKDGTAVTTADLKSLFGNKTNDIELIIQNEKGEGSKSLVHYNPELSENLELVQLTEETRQLNGYAEPGTVIMVTWKSLTYNSVVVADASQGYFEVDIPKELENGDHTVLAYSVKSQKLSNYIQLFFNKVF